MPNNTETKLSDDLLDMSLALAGALTSKNKTMLRATVAIVAENLQKSSIEKAEKLEKPRIVLISDENGETEITSIDLRGVLPFKGKVS